MAAAGAEALFAGGFPNLKKLDVGWNFLEAAVVDRLRGRFPEVVSERQRQNERYCLVWE
jgi:hypothetical protein